MEPTVIAFIAGMGFGLLLNRSLRWAVDARFRVERRIARYRAVHGGG